MGINRTKCAILLTAASLSCCPTRPSLPDPLTEGKAGPRYEAGYSESDKRPLKIRIDENILKAIGLFNEKPVAVFNLDTSYVVFGKKGFVIQPKPNESFSPYWEAAGKGLPDGFEVKSAEASHSDYWGIGVHLNGKYYGHYRVRDGKVVREK